MCHQLLNANTVSFWIGRKVFTEFILNIKFFFFLQLLDNSSRKLFGNRA